MAAARAWARGRAGRPRDVMAAAKRAINAALEPEAAR
jgi:hypothetical protein